MLIFISLVLSSDVIFNLGYLGNVSFKAKLPKDFAGAALEFEILSFYNFDISGRKNLKSVGLNILDRKFSNGIYDLSFYTTNHKLIEIYTKDDGLWLLSYSVLWKDSNYKFHLRKNFLYSAVKDGVTNKAQVYEVNNDRFIFIQHKTFSIIKNILQLLRICNFVKDYDISIMGRYLMKWVRFTKYTRKFYKTASSLISLRNHLLKVKKIFYSCEYAIKDKVIVVYNSFFEIVKNKIIDKYPCLEVPPVDILFFLCTYELQKMFKDHFSFFKYHLWSSRSVKNELSTMISYSKKVFATPCIVGEIKLTNDQTLDIEKTRILCNSIMKDIKIYHKFVDGFLFIWTDKSEEIYFLIFDIQLFFTNRTTKFMRIKVYDGLVYKVDMNNNY